MDPVLTAASDALLLLLDADPAGRHAHPCGFAAAAAAALLFEVHFFKFTLFDLTAFPIKFSLTQFSFRNCKLTSSLTLALGSSPPAKLAKLST